jgi:hypothetical protein
MSILRQAVSTYSEDCKGSTYEGANLELEGHGNV